MNLLFLDFCLAYYPLLAKYCGRWKPINNEAMWWHFIKLSDRNWATLIIIFVMLMITQILAARIWYLEYAKTMLIICIIRTLCIMMCSATTEKNLQFPLSKICRYMYKIIGRKDPEGQNAFDCWCVIYPAREETCLGDIIYGNPFYSHHPAGL